MTIACFIISLLILLYATYTDTQKRQVNPYPVYAAMLIGFILHIFDLSFWGFLLRFVLIAAIFVFYKGFIGGGDAKLLMMITLLNGPIVACLTLALASVFVLITEYRSNHDEFRVLTVKNLLAFVQGTVSEIKGKGKTVPVVPYMTIAFILVNVIGLIF